MSTTDGSSTAGRDANSWRLDGPARDLGVTVSRAIDGDVDLVEVVGPLDIHTHAQLRDVFRGDDAVTAARVVLDLSGVTFLDSTGIGAIATARASTSGREAELHVVAASSQVLKLLRITGLDQVLPVHETREQALGS